MELEEPEDIAAGQSCNIPTYAIYAAEIGSKWEIVPSFIRVAARHLFTVSLRPIALRTANGKRPLARLPDRAVRSIRSDPEAIAAECLTFAELHLGADRSALGLSFAILVAHEARASRNDGLAIRVDVRDRPYERLCKSTKKYLAGAARKDLQKRYDAQTEHNVT